MEEKVVRRRKRATAVEAVPKISIARLLGKHRKRGAGRRART